MKKSSSATLVFAWLLNGATFFLLLISLSTDHWYWIRVDGLPNGQDTSTNSTVEGVRFGLWRICYEGSLGSLHNIPELRGRSGTTCVGHTFKTSNLKYLPGFNADDNTDVLLDLASAVCMLVGVVLLFVVQWLQIAGFWPATPCAPLSQRKLCLRITILTFLAVVLCAGSEVIFSVARRIRSWNDTDSPHSSERHLVEGFGWSYLSSWAGTATGLISIVLYIILALSVVDEEIYKFGGKTEADITRPGGNMPFRVDMPLATIQPPTRRSYTIELDTTVNDQVEL